MRARLQTTELEKLPDADLVRRCKEGDERCLAVLLARHSDPLYHFCCSLMPSREDAEDICQEAMTRAIMRVDSLHTSSAFRSWLFSIAKNLSIDSFRTGKRVSPLAGDEVHSDPALDAGPHATVEAREERQTVAMALGRLRERHQRVLMLREVDGLSYAAIAEKLEVSESAVETLLFRARRRLREEYTRSDKPKAIVVAIGGLRGTLLRLTSPLGAGTPLAAKLAFTAAVATGTVALTPAIVPQAFHPVPRGSRDPAFARIDAPARPSMPPVAVVGGSFTGVKPGPIIWRTGTGGQSSSLLGHHSGTATMGQDGLAGAWGGTSMQPGRQASDHPLMVSPIATSLASSVARAGATASLTNAASEGEPSAMQLSSGQTVDPGISHRAASIDTSSVRSAERTLRRPAIHPSTPGPRRQALSAGSSHGSITGTADRQRPDRAEGSGPKAGTEPLPAISDLSTPHKQSQMPGVHVSHAVGGSGAGSRVPDRTRVPAVPQPGLTTPAQLPAAVLTVTPVQVQPGTPQIPATPGTSTSGGRSQGRNPRAPSARSTPQASLTAATPTPVPQLPSATSRGTPHAKPRP